MAVTLQRAPLGITARKHRQAVADRNQCSMGDVAKWQRLRDVGFDGVRQLEQGDVGEVARFLGHASFTLKESIRPVR